MAASCCYSQFIRTVLASLLIVVVCWQSQAVASGAPLRVELQMDGSAQPPGDLLKIIFRPPSEAKNIMLSARAFLISGEANTKQQPVSAQTDRNADARGIFQVRREVTPGASGQPVEADLVIPYADLKIPQGRHQLGYEVTVEANGQPLAVCAAPLSIIIVSDQARETMTLQKTKRKPITRTKKTLAYLGDKEKSASETLAPRPTEIVTQGWEVEQSIEQMAVKIPGGYAREALRIKPEVPRGDSSESALPAPAPSQPATALSATQPAKERLIYFATNRDRLPVTRINGPLFGVQAVAEITYGVCQVDLAVSQQRPGNVNPLLWWALGSQRNPYSVESIKIQPAAAFLKSAAPQDLLLFVHGFNNSFQDAILRAAQLKHDLDFSGPTVAFTWPSAGAVTSYKEDAASAAESVAALVAVLKLLRARAAEPLGGQAGAAPRGVRKIHVIAHSMGNRLLLLALEELRKSGGLATGERPFGQMILAAPDVGAAAFNNQVDNALQYSDQVTYYFSAHDAALHSSQSLNNYEPVGLYPYFEAGLCTIDAGNANRTLLGHTYFGDSSQVLQDIQLTLARGYPPSQRLPPLAGKEQLFGHDYWFFPPREP